MQSFDHMFLAWARKQPAGETYEYFNIRGCALYRFCEAMGLPVEACGATDWADTDGEWHPVLPDGSTVVYDAPHTYGALADRLAAALVSA